MFSGYHIRSDDVDRVSTAGRGVLRGEAWLSVPSQDWISLYDAYLDRVDPDEMVRVATALSERLETVVLGCFVQPTAQLVYVLTDRGQWVDGYVSRPDALALSVEERSRYQGHADRLMGYVQPGVAAEALDALLHGGPPPGSGLSAEQVDVMRKQLQARLPGLANPQALQPLLQAAAEQLRRLPPTMLEGFLRSMGLPPEHPALADMRANPGEFFARMANDSEALRQFSDNIAHGFAAGPNEAVVPPQDQAIALAHLFGIDPSRMPLSFRAVAGLGALDGFRRLSG